MRAGWGYFASCMRPHPVRHSASKTRVNALMTRHPPQHPNSGLPEFGILDCRSRKHPTSARGGIRSGHSSAARVVCAGAGFARHFLIPPTAGGWSATWRPAKSTLWRSMARPCGDKDAAPRGAPCSVLTAPGRASGNRMFRRPAISQLLAGGHSASDKSSLHCANCVNLFARAPAPLGSQRDASSPARERCVPLHHQDAS